jgi:DNA-directed RNA polymerase specialized sigma24 family protein
MTSEHDRPEEVVPHADIELRDRLQAVGCAGPVWDLVAAEFARYGWSVMSAWLSSRLIAGKCREKGRPVDLPDNWSAADREDLVATAVAHGLETFRKALVADRWKPEKGASLRTYFLGGCVLAFPNALRQWAKDRRRYHEGTTAWAREQATRSSVVEPVDMVDALDALKSLIRDESDRDQAILFLCFHNYLPKEIAEILGMSHGAVNTALYRMRRRQLGGDEGRPA